MKFFIDGRERILTSANFNGQDFIVTTDDVAQAQPPDLITEQMLNNPVFSEDWSNPKIGGANGVWARNMANPDILFHQANHEAQAWVYPQRPAGIDYNPFVVSRADGFVAITARAATEAERRLVYGQPVLSGLLANWPVMAKTYGYFEVAASWNSAPGMWPAIWLLKYDPDEPQPQPGTSWPPEIDIMEHVPSLGASTVHINTWWQDPVSGITSSGSPVDISNGLISNWNKYGVLWTEKYVAHYINRALVNVVENKGLHEPMHIVLDLAWGGKGSWPGETDLTRLSCVYFGRIGVWNL